jgi:hypothetical protein
LQLPKLFGGSCAAESSCGETPCSNCRKPRSSLFGSLRRHACESCESCESCECGVVEEARPFEPAAPAPANSLESSPSDEAHPANTPAANAPAENASPEESNSLEASDALEENNAPAETLEAEQLLPDLPPAEAPGRDARGWLPLPRFKLLPF